MTFVYITKVQTFLAERIDENPDYSECIKLFEFIVGRDYTIGEPLEKLLPASIRIFKTILSGTEPLAFSYWWEKSKDVEVIRVIDVRFFKDLLP